MYEKALKEYKEDGVTMIEAFFSQSEVNGFLESIGRFVDQESAKLERRAINYTQGQVNSIHALDKSSDGFFSNLLETPRVRELAEEFLKSDVYWRAAELFAKPPKVGLRSPWHQDNAYWCVDDANALTIWIALDPCDESNGAVIYFKGSQKLGLIEHKPSFAPGSSQTIADESLIQKLEQDRVSYKMKPGDILVHNVLTVHGSDPNKSNRPRRAMTLQYISKNSKIDESMKKRYEANLEMQIKARNT